MLRGTGLLLSAECHSSAIHSRQNENQQTALRGKLALKKLSTFVRYIVLAWVFAAAAITLAGPETIAELTQSDDFEIARSQRGAAAGAVVN